MTTIRPATTADVEAIAQVDVETWRSSYAGVLPDQLLIGMSAQRRALFWSRFVTRRPGDTIVAIETRSNQVLGFGSCGAQREPDLPYAGEIFTLYVHPDYQNQGIGRPLLMALFAQLLKKDMASAVIWVLAENPARFFYEHLGGKLAARQHMEVGRTKIGSVAYGWPDIADAIRSSGRTKSRID
jgi:ribosomal protein S18 acetylase RimI-like enzyme